MIGAVVRGAVLLLALVAVGAGLVYLGRCTADPHNPAQAPVVESGSSTAAAVDDAGPRGRWSPTEGTASPVSRGRTDPLPPADPVRRTARRYAADALATDGLPVPDAADLGPEPLPAPDAPGLLPPVRVSRDGDVGALAVLDSRGAWQREEQRCPEGRRWEAGTTTDGAGFYGNCERAVPALLPAVGKNVAVCAGIGALAAALAAASDAVNGDADPVVRPVEAGVGGAALCGTVVVLRATL